ncbi:hypothetical protein D3C85_1040220 [compost metagenome]
MCGVRLGFSEFFIRFDGIAALFVETMGIINQLIQISAREPQNGLVQTLFAIGPQPLKALQRQVVVVAQIDTAQQHFVAAIQSLFRNRCDVIATEVQYSEPIGVEHTVRPFGQIVVAQIEGLQRFKSADIKGIQFVVAQVQPFQPFQMTQRGIQLLVIAYKIRGHFEPFQLTHVLNRVRHNFQSIAIEFQRFQLRKCPEEPI